MKKLLYFSDHFRPAYSAIRFWLRVGYSAVLLCFKRSRAIKCLHLDYAHLHQFDNGYLRIHYAFRNALWYHFKGVKRTTDEGMLIVAISRLPETFLKLVVYGLFRKRVYTIRISPAWRLNSGGFKAQLSGATGQARWVQQPHMQVRRLKPVAIPAITTRMPAVRLQLTPLQVNQSIYHQTDFL